MSDVVWLTAIPLVLLGITIWQPSLVTAVPTFIGIYVSFIVGLFTAPLTTVAIVWLAFAIAVVPFLFYRFPGQYNFARSLTTLFIWPILAAICAIVERQVTRVVPPGEVPSLFQATVSFIDSAGTEADYLMVFLNEFDDTAFFCDGALESAHGLEEDAAFRFEVAVKSVDGISGETLWIESIEPLADGS